MVWDRKPRLGGWSTTRAGYVRTRPFTYHRLDVLGVRPPRATRPYPRERAMMCRVLENAVHFTSVGYAL